MNAKRLIVASSILLLCACSGHAGDVEGPFSHADSESEEAEAIARLIAKCDGSEGRFTYACHCEDVAGNVLYFDPAIAAASEGKTVHVAIRLLDEKSFGPEPISVCTVWHTVVSAANLKSLLAKAQTFFEVGDPLPIRS